jgi:hypothetical protein
MVTSGLPAETGQGREARTVAATSMNVTTVAASASQAENVQAEPGIWDERVEDMARRYTTSDLMLISLFKHDLNCRPSK